MKFIAAAVFAASFASQAHAVLNCQARYQEHPGSSGLRLYTIMMQRILTKQDTSEKALVTPVAVTLFTRLAKDELREKQVDLLTEARGRAIGSLKSGYVVNFPDGWLKVFPIGSDERILEGQFRLGNGALMSVTCVPSSRTVQIQ